MTMFDGYEDMDLYEAIIRDDETILNLFISKIDELKRIFTEHQIKLLRALLRADEAVAKHDLENVREYLRQSCEEELLSIVT
jgi:hypothetical protein